MNILVTGGAGYIGSACIKKLSEEGHNISVVDNLSSGRRELVPDSAKFFELDLAKDDLSSLFENDVDAILHMAAYKDAGASMFNLPLYSENITGTVRLLDEAVKKGIKQIIYSSSALTYGDVKYTPIDEQHPTIPVNYYGFTKLKCEELIEWYAKRYNFQYVNLRYFNPIGDGGLKYIDPNAKNLTPLLMEVAAGKRDKIMVYGNDYPTVDGTCVRDYIDLNDLVEAHTLALDLKTSETINLGTAKGSSVIEMIGLTEKITGKKINYEIYARREGDPPILVAAYDKAKQILGWEPKTSIEDSLESVWKVYRY
jgi:UDP-glucose 4-epimerase